MAWASSGGYPGVRPNGPGGLLIPGPLAANGQGSAANVVALETEPDGSVQLCDDSASFSPDGTGVLATGKIAWSPAGGFAIWNKNIPDTQPTVSQALVTAVTDANTKAALQALLDALDTSTILHKVA